MKTFLIFLFAITLRTGGASGETKVYICDSPTAVAYHSDKYLGDFKNAPIKF